jgi:hypothetical protein
MSSAEPDESPVRGLTTATQKIVAETWSGVLEKEVRDAEDDFFEVGGNSMLATLATYQLRERFTLELPLMLIFENPTVGELAQAIDERVAEAG